MQSLNAMLKRTASVCMTPLAHRAAKSYIAGPELVDALRVAKTLAASGFQTTLGFWDGPDDSPASVLQEYVRAIAALADDDDDCYLSIKLPALGDSRELLRQVLAQTRLDESGELASLSVGRCAATAVCTPRSVLPSASASAIRIHFDSLAPETADATWSAAVDAAAAGNEVSSSLPGRWRRSVRDAEAAIEAGIVPRVVKGQWPDSDGRDLDMRAGFMSLVRQLAGRAPHVAVASHDVPLTREAIRHLLAAGTSCELELLYGLPERDAVAMARHEGVPVRFYVPYGRAYLPYCLGQIRRQPRLLWWLVRDALRRA